MQIIGNKFQEEKILNVAYTLENEIKFREKFKPEFKGGENWCQEKIMKQ